MSEKCEKPIHGPFGSCVGWCELAKNHEGSCRVNGVSEQDMVDQLWPTDSASEGQNHD